MKNEKNTLMWILLVIVLIATFFLPKIYNFVGDITTPKVKKSQNNANIEVKKVTDEVISDIHFPIMRNSKYNKDTYYNLDVFRNSDMSNSDKLLSAYLKLEKVSIVNNTFKSIYIDLLIDNVLGKDIKYNLESFYVPIDSKQDYKGYWNYDAGSSMFIYQGGNNNENTNIEYYNLEQKIKAEYENKTKDIVIYYYVGFAKVEGNNYIIYSDPNMTNTISEGILDSDLNTIFSKIDNKKKKIYKYTFKKTICSYSEYCLYEGKWINEL